MVTRSEPSPPTSKEQRKEHDDPENPFYPRSPIKAPPTVDEELVEAARRLDEQAWEEIYRVLYPRLIAFARQRLDEDRADDAVSEAMARAVAGIGRFEWKGTGFEAWLFGILRHVVIDKYRRSGRAKRQEFSYAFESDTASDRLIAEEEAIQIRRAFAELPESDQELLHLRVVTGLSSEAVASILGKRSGAVRTAQARALRRLRGLMEEKERKGESHENAHR